MVCTQPETVFLRFSPSGKLRFTSSHFPRPYLYFTASAFFHPFHFITAARMPSLLPSTAPSNISVKGTPHKPPFFVAHASRGAPYFKRYASAPFGVSGIVLQVNPHVGHSCPHPPMVISPCPLGHSPLRMRKSLSIYRSLSPGFPPSTSIRSGSARSISISRPFKPRITQRSMSRFALDLRQLALPRPIT